MLHSYYESLKTKRKKHNQYPAIATKIDSLNPKHYVYQPNPEHYQHDTEYLAWNLEYSPYSLEI